MFRLGSLCRSSAISSTPRSWALLSGAMFCGVLATSEGKEEPMWPSDCAFLLVYHGSRDPRPLAGTEQLANLVRDDFSGRAEGRDVPLIGTAYLELAEVELGHAIAAFARTAKARGVSRVRLVPLFLIPGVHITEDIPEEVELANKRLAASCDSDVVISTDAEIGAGPGILALLRGGFDNMQLAKDDDSARVLVAHGTKRSHGNEVLVRLAAELQASMAYYFIKPKLEGIVADLAEKGTKKIGIVMYFLFEGTISDKVHKTVGMLRQEYPDIEIECSMGLGPTPLVARAIVDELLRHS